MKHFTILLSLFFALSFNSKASHVEGGEITWNCLSNGQYVFSMVVYISCNNSAAHIFQDETIDIVGTPLPTNGITSIIVKPDSNALQSANGGDTSPSCTANYGTPYSCNTGSPFTTKAFLYKSDPITLTGVPPSSGWKFYWTTACCRSTSDNINSRLSNTVLRSIMYPSVNNTVVDFCFDSSPRFVELPQLLLCRSSLQTYNHVAQDKEGDSLSYAWGQVLSGSSNSVQPVNYSPGYNFNNPTPDAFANPSNIPSSLNATSGDVEFAVYSGSNSEQFLTVVEVTNWRNNRAISRVYREVPFTIVDCPTLPSGRVNQLPTFSIPVPLANDGVYRDSVVAGTLISHSVNVTDFDSVGMMNNNFQNVTLVVYGESFNTNYALNGSCRDTNRASCAYLLPSPSLNPNNYPVQYELNGIAGISTSFRWQTDCTDLKDSLFSKTHYFTFKFLDDHCPVPQIGYKTMAITVIPSSQPCSTITSVADVSKFQHQFSLFPNPGTGRFTINGNEMLESVEMKIRNIHGQLVQREVYLNASKYVFDLNSESGVYFVQLKNNKGETANFKLIKQ